MKGLAKTTLATALALATGQALALGLGPIQVRSGLNQPLVAEIPVLADTPAEVNELRVDLASAEDFARVGLNRGRVNVPLEFSVSNNGKQSVIKITTKDIVREPFLDFLIEINWSKGKLLREYTVLLDPPVTAPAVPATSKPVPRPMPSSAPAPAMTTPRAETRPLAEAPAPAAAPVAPSTPRASSPAPRAPSEGGQYGPVQRGQALSSIARGLDVTTPLNINQVMLALLKANPQAFYKDNVNALKTGAVLRIPSADEVAATGSLKEAAAAVVAQNQSWSEGGKVTQVNNAGASAAPPAVEAPSSKPSSSTKSNDRLALVPPASGKGSESGSAGGSSGGSAKDSETRAELSRTKESLATKEQESAELRSRVKQLEDINNKGQTLISLKDNEIAELQNKLKELQAKSSSSPASSTSSTTATKPADTSKPVEVPAVPVLPPKSDASKPADALASKPADTTAPVKPADATATTPSSTAAVTPSSSTAPSAATPTTAPSSSTSTPPGGATVTPLPDSTTSASTPPPAASTTPAPAAAPAAAKPKPAAAPKPAPVDKPWWSDYLGDSPYPLYGLGAVLLLLGAWAASRLFSKPKSAVRPSYADVEPSADVVPPANEQQLLDHLAEHPDDTDAAMELLRHYYVQGEVGRFEDLAAQLQTRLPADSPQWEEVLAMGRDLSPHHALFAEAAAAEAVAAHDVADHFHAEHDTLHHDVAHDFAADTVHGNVHDLATPPYETVVDHPRPDLETQRFDFEDLNTHAAEHVPAPAPLEPSFEPVRDVEYEPVHAAPAPAVHGDDVDHEAAATEFFTGEDTISTRLDLARAYLDMGDPEGARSMLDEVLAEGNPVQKEEARKLLAEIR